MAETVPYQVLVSEAQASSTSVPDYLKSTLPVLWFDAYVQMVPRQTNVLVFTHGTFDYLYDDQATLEATGAVQADPLRESRLVAAIGVSRTNARKRDDSRLRGWVGPTGVLFGDAWDKGHYIAHSIGGAVDGLEANVFLQLRSVNRGGYRRMERYCAAQPGTLCFSRPIYSDQSARPSAVEFGVLKPSGDLWVETFVNQ
jgi:hypothetical protein